jgi:outer membrane protein assembly factor BamA
VYGYCPSTGSATCPPNTYQYTPIGGGGLVDGSVELRFPISGELGGATFLDFGNVMVNAADTLNTANLQYALGAGIRYKTAFGPIRLDLAGRLPIPDGQPGVEVLDLCYVNSPPGQCSKSAPPGTKATLLTTGRIHHYPIVSFHFSIGEAF